MNEETVSNTGRGNRRRENARRRRKNQVNIYDGVGLE